MRKEFAKELHKQMEQNNRIFFLTGDLGYGIFDDIMKDFPNRAYNCGASEKAMSDIAVGLALENKIPFVYSITTFLLYRGFETIRTYINHEKLNVKLVASGRDKDYAHDGISHWSEDAKDILNTLPNIHQYWPNEETNLERLVKIMIKCKSPDFVSLRR